MAPTRKGRKGQFSGKPVRKPPAKGTKHPRKPPARKPTRRDNAQRRQLQKEIAVRRKKLRRMPKASSCSSTLLVLVALIGGLVLLASHR